MPRSILTCWVVWAVLAAGEAELRAQEGPATLPARPRTETEAKRREARILYGVALLRQRQDRLLDAASTLEEAVKLDPQSASMHRALVPLYLALFRPDDALAACRKVLELEPDDHETWYVLGQQLRVQGKSAEARAAWKRAAACVGLADRPELRAQVLHDLGGLCESLNDYDTALSAYEEVAKLLEKPEALLDAGPFNADQIREQAASTCERIIKVCIQAKQYDRALQTFDEASKKYPGVMKRLHQNLAQVCIAQGRPEAALRHLNEYLRTQPHGIEAYEQKLTLMRQLGHADDIVAEMEEYARRDAYNNGLKLLLARELGRAGETARAESEYQTLLEQQPTPEVYRGLFTLYKDMARMDKALALFDAALAAAEPEKRRGPRGEEIDAPAADPVAAAKARAMIQVLREDKELVKAVLPAARQKLTEPQPFRGPRGPRAMRSEPLQRKTRYFLAVMAARTGQLDDAERLYRHLLETSGPGRSAEHVAYAGLLQVLEQAHRDEEVVDIAKQGLEGAQQTNRQLFHQYLSVAYLNLGKTTEAVAAANDAVDVAQQEDRLASRLHRVRILTRAERTEAAAEECRELLKEYAKPEQARDIRHALANVYAQMRDWPRAEEQLLTILKSDPNDNLACNDLGYFWADQSKNLDEAERLIRKAIDLHRQQRRTGAVGPDDDRDHAAYLDSLGWVLFRRGQLDEARAWLEKAAALPDGNDDPEVWNHLGDVYFRQEQQGKAAAAWKKAAGLYETNRRRKADDKYRELKQKLKLLEPEPHPREEG